jgi:hypothetical protein
VSSSFSLSLLYVVSSRLNAAFVPVTSVCTAALSVLARAFSVILLLVDLWCIGLLERVPDSG